MATNIGTLEAVIRADASDLEKTLGRVKGFMGGIGKRAAMMGGAIAAAGAAGAAALGVKSVRAAGNFEEAITAAASKVDMTEQTLKSFEEAAVQAGVESAFSAQKAADALGFLAQAGFEAEEATSALPGVLQMAEAANMGLAQAADIASNVLTGMNLEVSELSRVSDTLVKTANSANTNVSQMGQAMSMVAPQAAAAGMSVEQTAAAIGMLGNAGIQGSRAGTTLRGALARLSDPSDKAASAMERLGVSVKTSGGEVRGLVPILQDLQDAQAGTTEMTQIFGRRAGPGMQALLSQGIGSLREFTGILEDAGGTAENVAMRMRNTLNGQLNILKGSFDTLLITIGQELKPMVKEAASELTALTNSFRSSAAESSAMGDKVRHAIKTLAQFGKLLGPFIELAGQTAAGLGMLGSGFLNLGAYIQNTYFKGRELYADMQDWHKQEVEYSKAIAENLNAVLDRTYALNDLHSAASQSTETMNALSDVIQSLAGAKESTDQAKDAVGALGQEIQRLQDKLKMDDVTGQLEKNIKSQISALKADRKEAERLRLEIEKLQQKMHFGDMTPQLKANIQSQVDALKNQRQDLLDVGGGPGAGGGGGGGDDDPAPTPTPPTTPRQQEDDTDPIAALTMGMASEESVKKMLKQRKIAKEMEVAQAKQNQLAAQKIAKLEHQAQLRAIALRQAKGQLGMDEAELARQQAKARHMERMRSLQDEETRGAQKQIDAEQKVTSEIGKQADKRAKSLDQLSQKTSQVGGAVSGLASDLGAEGASEGVQTATDAAGGLASTVTSALTGGVAGALTGGLGVIGSLFGGLFGGKRKPMRERIQVDAARQKTDQRKLAEMIGEQVAKNMDEEFGERQTIFVGARQAGVPTNRDLTTAEARNIASGLESIEGVVQNG